MILDANDNTKIANSIQRLIKRLRKVQLDNLGDVEPVGEGVFKMREHLGQAGACTMSSTASW